jgi:two-component system, chemotaxis family, protein-glutamate methylesterase/glutaminase
MEVDPALPGRDIVLIGASAGGVHALSQVVALLPPGFPAAVFVVLHLSPYGSSAMPAILSRAGALPAAHPVDGEPIRRGRIYVAPPDQHLLIEPGRVRLSRGPTENGHRPAVDVLFRSGGQVYGPRAIGVILTGNLDDGTAGLATIKKQGGIAVVQDPREADYPSMPQHAIATVDVDHVLPIAEIVPLLVRLVTEPPADPDSPPGQDPPPLDIKDELERGEDREGKGEPSGLTCPECGGTLFERNQGEIVHFRCRTGHAYSPESLLAVQFQTLEATLWAAVRALEENAALARRMARSMSQKLRSGSTAAEVRYNKRAEEAERHANQLRLALLQDETGKAEEGVVR